MPVFTRRNAALGWGSLLIIKFVVRRRVRAAARAAEPGGRHLKRKVLALLVALAVGGAVYSRRQSADPNLPPEV